MVININKGDNMIIATRNRNRMTLEEAYADFQERRES